ncbi:MAG TPA: hypothetical protein VGF24_33105 [Vicinamibacterales bacterium]|jgi:hypothetical protein
MRRTGGVIASGIIAIVGSLVTILIGILLVVTVSGMRANPLPAGSPTPPINIPRVLIAEAVVLVGFGIFGIVSAIALFMLKNWARISFLVFACLLALFSVTGMIGTTIGTLLAPQMATPGQAPPQGILTGVLVMFAVIWLLLLGLSIWWLYYLTRRSVNELFQTGAEIDTPRRGPLSVTIIAWLLTIGGLFAGVTVFASYPVFMFGMLFTGWTARLVLIPFGVVNLVAGIGMLRWRLQAHTLAVALYGFYLLSTITSVILPGSIERMQVAMQQMGYPEAPVPALSTSFIGIGMVISVLAVCVPLFFLITRRRAFLEACTVAEVEG